MDVLTSEPTHRYGRALDDRLPAVGAPPWARAQAEAAAAEGGGVTTASAAPPGTGAGGDGLSFGDLLDAVNPLHHLPIVGPLYREWSGDEIGPAARIAGGGLFGGLVGAALSLADVALEEISGDDLGGHVMTALFGDEEDGDGDGEGGTAAPVRVADAGPAEDAQALPASPLPAVPAAASTAAETAPARQRHGTGHGTGHGAGRAAPLPTLSPAAFDALIGSFGADAQGAGQDGGRDTGPPPLLAPPPGAPLVLGRAPEVGRLFDRAL